MFPARNGFPCPILLSCISPSTSFPWKQSPSASLSPPTCISYFFQSPYNSSILSICVHAFLPPSFICFTSPALSTLPGIWRCLIFRMRVRANKWMQYDWLWFGVGNSGLSLWIFSMCIWSVSFCPSFGLILTVPVPPYCFLVASPTTLSLAGFGSSPGASIVCHHTLSAPLYHILLCRDEQRFTVAALQLAAVRIKTH